MKTKIILAMLCTTLLWSACGEDRSGEYKELTKETQWIYQTMDDYYLWYDQMPSLSNSDYFKDAETFFNKLKISSDKYSYIEMLDEEETRSISYQSTYGFDFALYIDPLGGSSNVYARVTLVLPGSPASEAGMQRGCWISAVDGTKLTRNNYPLLAQGGAAAMQTVRVGQDEESGSPVWEPGETLQLSAARSVRLNPFYIDTVYHVEEQKIAYLVYTQFTPGPNYEAEETEYNEVMNRIFARFKSQEADQLILDLRFNPGGYLSCAQQLSSLIVGDDKMGETFCTLKFNNKQSKQNSTLRYNSELTEGNNLGLKKLYVITSANTASASEAVIYGLRSTLGDDAVITLGTTTEGKNLASIAFDKEGYAFVLHPIVAQIYDSRDRSDYGDGIEPTYKIDELGYINDFCPIGDVYEIMLYNTLCLILYDEVPDAAPASSANSRVRRATRGAMQPLRSVVHGTSEVRLHNIF